MKRDIAPSRGANASRAMVVVAVIGLSAALLAPGRDATVDAQTSAAAPAARLELIGQTLAVEPDGTISLEYRLTGIVDDALELAPRPVEPAPPVTVDTVPGDTIPGDTVAPTPEPPAPPLRLTVDVTNYRPLTSSDDVADVVGSDVDPDAFDGAIDGVRITDLRDRVTVADDGTVEFTLEIGTDVVDSVEQQLKFDRLGLYPVRVQLLVGDPRDGNVVATAGTIVQRVAAPADASPPPIDLSVVAVTPPPPLDATAAEAAAAQRALEDAVDLAATLDAPVTLEVPPTLIAEQAATPQGAEQLAQSLSGDELVALPVVPLDVSSAVAAGRADTFTRLVNAGEELLTVAVPTTPSLRSVWMTTDPLSAGGAQQLRDLGVRFVIMPAALYRSTVDAVLPETDLFVDAALPDGGTLPILVVDPRARELTPAAAAEILATSTATEWSVETAAEILIDRSRADVDDPGPAAHRSLVLTTPDLSSPDAGLLGALEDLVATTPSLRFASASSLIGGTDTQRSSGEPVTVQLPDTAGPSLAGRVELIDRTALTMASAASMLPPDDPRPVTWTNTLDALISTGYSEAVVAATTTALTAEADALKNAVQLPVPFTFTLAGRSGTIEIRVGNTSDEPLDVTVQLESSKIEFPEGDRQITLRPNDETAVVVPVEARSNGTSSITLTVTTPAGETIAEPVTLTSRVTGFTGLGQLLTGGLILVLLTWWFSHWRARRRDDDIDEVQNRHPAGRKVDSDAL